MKSLTAVAILSIQSMAFAGGEGWTSDFEAAKKEAAESNKDLLIDFTGSDWCGWCIRLNKEVFQHDAFKEGVKDKFVLVELDFPKDKSKITEETLAQNKVLAKEYGVRGYPTILLADAEGRPYAKTGYRKGGPENYVAHLNELRELKAKRDVALGEAEAKEGVAKAESLVAVLDALPIQPEMVAKFYPEVIEAIKSADPEDETGYQKRGQAKERMQAFQTQLQKHAQAKQWDEAMKLVDQTLEEGGLDPNVTFNIEMMRVVIYAEQSKFDEALQELDKLKAAHPNHPAVGQLDQFRKQLVAGKDKAAGVTEQ